MAAGRTDAFWQYGTDPVDLLAGVLLIREAGGTVTDTHGLPWHTASDIMLGTAPSLHTAFVDVLSPIS